MIMSYCESCKRKTGHKRALGWGTFFAAVLTFGGWLVMIPLYKPRCVICGSARATDPRFTLAVVGAIILGVLVLVWLNWLKPR